MTQLLPPEPIMIEGMQFFIWAVKLHDALALASKDEKLARKLVRDAYKGLRSRRYGPIPVSHFY